MKKKDLTGRRFGRLTVIADSGERRDKCVVWECVCDCGNHCNVPSKLLLGGNTKSCGCLLKESRSKNGRKNATHGMSKERIYKIYREMIRRCYNKNNKGYKNYGGRGISVCDEWLADIVAFKTWAISAGYNDTLTIERKDVNKDYSPENCTWIPISLQSKNRRNNVLYQSRLLKDEAIARGLNSYKVWQRVHKLGWSIEEALELAPHKQKSLSNMLSTNTSQDS